jgi:hypothetical protein
MTPRVKKVLLCLLALVLLVVSSQVQRSLNKDRKDLGLTRVEPLKNAPPVLAFTTVALGGFRGIISNILWMRATDLQDEDKFFEMAQLADWITKLEPHFVQVWLHQAWNMAYNISVKFKDWPDRWRWVERGIELLRDDGLDWNPNEMLIYRELGWIFQHKLGQNLDDANMYYKQQWANEMAVVFDKKTPNLDELIHPVTEDQKRRAALLRNKYKMDPEIMKEVDAEFGPLEWRLPEAHAIYWANLGLREAAKHPEKIKKDDLITLHRVVYQSMQLSFQRGRLVSNPFVKQFEFGPNLDIIPNVSKAYEEAAEEDKDNHDHILRAHRNFLRDAVYFLYGNNRLREANYWFKYLGQHYPDKPIIDGQPDSLPAKVTLDEYCVGRIMEDVKETDKARVTAIIEGLFANYYTSLILDDQEERALGFKLFAEKVYATYMAKIPKERTEAIGLDPIDDLRRRVLNRLLDTEHGLQPVARAALRSKLGMPAETPKAAVPSGQSASTNAPSQTVSKQP